MVYRILLQALLLIILATLGGCGGGNNASTAVSSQYAANVVVRGEHLESLQIQDAISGIKADVVNATKEQYSAATKEYSFQLNVHPGPKRYQNITIVLEGVGQGTTIVQSTVQTGVVSANASITPSDRITIRHNLANAFEPSVWRWSIVGTLVPGVLLEGQPGQQASTVVKDVAIADSELNLEVGASPDGTVKFYTAQLLAAISNAATVGQVNTALDTVGARIVSSNTTNPVIVLEVPSTVTLDALNAVAAKLESSGAFDAVTPVFLPQGSTLPTNVSATDALAFFSPLKHQIAARIDTAWGAWRAGPVNPNVHAVVVDTFGKGA